MVLSGLPPSAPITATVSRQPSPTAVAAIAQPSESSTIRLTLATVPAGSASNVSEEANSARATVAEAATRAVPAGRSIIHDEFSALDDRFGRGVERREQLGGLVARHRIDRDADLPRVGQERGIL